MRDTYWTPARFEAVGKAKNFSDLLSVKTRLFQH